MQMNGEFNFNSTIAWVVLQNELRNANIKVRIIISIAKYFKKDK